MYVIAAITARSILGITASMFLASAYVLFEPFRRALRPLADLLVALRPLLIPVLVAAAAATVNFGAGVQALAAVLLVLIVARMIVQPELARGNERERLSRWVHGGIAVTAGIAFVIVLVYIESKGIDSVLSGQSGAAGAFLTVGLAALALAILARAVSYVTHPVRVVPVVLLLSAIVQSLRWIEVDKGADSSAKGLLLATCVALAVPIIVEFFWTRQSEFVTLHRVAETAAAVGVTLALLSGFFMIGATSSSLLALDDAAGHSVETRDRGPVPPKLYQQANATLEYRHAPVLAFTEEESWTPIPVRDYFRVFKAHVERQDRSHVPRPHGHGYSCPSIGPRKCLRVAIDCRSGDQPCARPLRHHERGEHVSNGLIYARVLTRNLTNPAKAPVAVAVRGIFEPLPETSLPKGGKEGIAHKTQVLLQYWFFYAYDEWTSRILGATFTQRHEGDWESVSVGLGKRNEPLFVAYSAHCGGSWEPWGRTVRYGTHPLVAVAHGSHGNYPNAGAQRPPDFTSCKRLPRGIGTLLAYAANVRDVTADRWEWGAARVKTVTEKKWPMNFPGTWGYNDVTQLRTHRDFGPSGQGPGPASPPLQALWQDPIRTIFCDRYWDHPEHQSCKQALRPG